MNTSSTAEELNHAAFLASGEAAISHLPSVEGRVRDELIALGVRVREYSVDPQKFYAYLGQADYPAQYREANGVYFPEKALEHFISTEFSTLRPNSVVIDVANAGSPFPEIAHKRFNCGVVSNDLCFPPGIHHPSAWHIVVGGNACQLPAPPNTFDLMVLHCALEMFEGEDDKDLITEAARVLKPGGKLVILPLYLHETYHIMRDPHSPRVDTPAVDPEARLIYVNDFHGVAFARIYSPAAMQKRLLSRCREHMEFTCYEVLNAQEIGSECYLAWIGVFEKHQ